jgi:cytochrome c-type biogenesis protein CcmH/NrfG
MAIEEKNDAQSLSGESPDMLSLCGFSLAKDSRQFKKGVALCEKAIALDSQNTDHYLLLGRVHLLAGHKARAIATFRRGLKIRKDNRLIRELQKIGIRKSPPFASLSRTNIFNIISGKLMHILKLR